MSVKRLFELKKFIMTYAVVAVFAMSVAYVMFSAKASTEMPAYITVEYKGNTVVVDGRIDKEQLRVCAVYDDGTIVEVEDYTLSTDKVKKEGENTISVIYLGKTANFKVVGKVVEEIFPYYTGEYISITNAIDARNLSVYVSFSDESFEEVKDYTVENATVNEEGPHDVIISYGGKSATLTVYGKELRPVSELFVTYTGDSVMLGNTINRDEIFLTAAFDDGSVESIINYEMSTDTPTMLGINIIVLSFENKTVTFELEGIPRVISKLEAEYKGGPVEIGKQVRKADIVVKATYSDGVTEIIEDFSLPSPTIYFVGTHVKTIHYMGLTTDIYVTGVEEAETSYENAAVNYTSCGYRTLTCAVAIPSGIDPSKLGFTSLSSSALSTALKRELNSKSFFIFSIDASDIDDELPLETKLTVPHGLKASECKLYYTPDCTTTIGTVVCDVVSENDIIFLLHKSGTYVLTYDGRLKRYLKKR